ncbi:MAG: D-alanyl-D-alanine carboxypeptidase [Oscillospiraceae bacterium]|nr:D-alanyl-D-alanine carboxypeptidase [Candidatus Ruminococcus equi]
MKKKLISCISLVIIFALCLCMTASAIAFDCPVDVSSDAAVLLNLEDNTVVFERNYTNARYLSNLSDIMTTMIVIKNVPNPEDARVEIKRSFFGYQQVNSYLTPYIDKTLSVLDLLYILMLTGDRYSALILADYVSKGNTNDFVDLMNKRAVELGCEKTHFSSPAATDSDTQYTTCRDFVRIILNAFTSDLFKEIYVAKSYVPSGYDEEDHLIITTDSLAISTSPYYFKYTLGGKFGKDATSGTNLVATFQYSKIRYLFIGFGAPNEAERNVYVDAKQLLSWAYTDLKSRKILSSSAVLTTANADSRWGTSTLELSAKNNINKTMPENVSEKDISYQYSVPEKVSLPVFKGQNIGTVSVYYRQSFVGEYDLVSQTNKGVDMMSDIGDLMHDMYDNLLPVKSEDLTEETTQQPATIPSE